MRPGLTHARLALAGFGEPRPDRARIGLTGDFVLGEAAEAAIGDRAFAPALDAWAHDLDLLVVSLDATFPGDDPKGWRPLVYAGPRVLRALPRGGRTVVNLGNNHAFDGGARGFANLRAALAAHGIEAVGAGVTRDEAERPWRGHVDGKRVVLYAAAHPGCHPRPPLRQGGEVALVTSPSWWAAIEDDARAGAVVVVLIHGGIQGSHYPSPRAIDISRRLARRGVSAVAWSHAHAVQGVAAVDRTLVAYGLGNALHPPLSGAPTRPSPDPAYDVGLLLELEPEPGGVSRAAGLLLRREGLAAAPMAADARRRAWFDALCAAPDGPGYALRWRWQRLREDVLRPLRARARDGSWRHARPRHVATLVGRLGNARADAHDV